MDTLLHAVYLPSNAKTETSAQVRRRLAKQGQVDGGPGVAQSISLEPNERLLTAYYSGQFTEIQRRMTEELFDAGGIEVVPIAAQGEDAPDDGYYVLEDVSGESPDPTVSRFARVQGRLVKQGTRRSHWRAVATNPQDVDNPFGSGATEEFGVSIRASKVRWFDDVGGDVGAATAQRTVEGEHDQLDIYDASEPSFDSPTLVYEIPYTQEYPTDCVVWDTYDRPKVYQETESGDTVGSATVGSATVSGDSAYVASQWQRVYVTDHDWIGDMVLETDRLRLVIDQPDDVLRAYRYDAGDGQYNLIQLGASDWRLWDVDLTHVGLTRLGAQFEFEDTSDGSRQNLNATLVRGLDDVLWTVPANETAPPQGLIDRLDPIAATTDRAVVPSGTLVKRSDVDR